jgi:hypothetical protein
MRFPKLLQRAGKNRQQQQSAGDSSQQFQASRDMEVHVHGVTAADVVSITRVEVDAVRSELTAMASRAGSLAEERLRAFQDHVVDQFADVPHLREAFADPDFQFSLRDAGRAAVSNDDQHTEDLLVDLLKNRAEQGNHARSGSPPVTQFERPTSCRWRH